VQGEKCAVEVSAAIDGFNKLPKELLPDLLIIARGGGALEDLQGFNEESVVLAASRSAIPIISAIGHETDHTLLDLVADRRAPTPTAAAEFAVPVHLELEAQLKSFALRSTQALTAAQAARGERLQDNLTRLARAPEFIYRLEQRVDDLTRHLPSALKNRFSLAKEKLSGVSLTPFIQNMLKDKASALRQFSLLLNAVSYQKVLERGFALVLDENNHLTQKAEDTKIGQHLKIEFAHRKQIDVQRIQPAKQGKLFDG
jgi:exodeoxyribonuclease VII large subunit